MSQPTVVITGALAGIGEEAARQFAANGYRVVFSGRRAARGAELQQELRAINPECHFVLADVTDEQQVTALVAKAQALYGRIDVALNIAGIEGKPTPVASFDSEDYRQVFDANVLGTQLVMKHVLPVMQAQHSGSVINISSVAGQVGMPGSSIYVASKHAVNGLTRTAALEVAADGVRVNAIAPGPVETEMFNRFVGNDAAAKAQFINSLPTRRITTTAEIAGIALFLASDAARSIIGQIITVDGGYSVG